MTKLILSFIAFFLFLSGCKDKQGSAGGTRDVEVQSDIPGTPAPMRLSGKTSGEELREASLAGNLAEVEALTAQNVNIDAIDTDGRTSLMLAAFNGHTGVVRFLLEKGALVNQTDFTGRTALMYASTGDNAETVMILLSNGAEVNVQDTPEKYTALMFAAAEGRLGVVKLLLENKADHRIKDKDDDTPESFARQNGHLEVAEYLKNFGK